MTVKRSRYSLQALKKFIERNKDSRELKRALAVKMSLEGLPLKAVAKNLNLSFQFVWKWKQVYTHKGIEALNLGYQGAVSYLKEKARRQIKQWLQGQENITVKELEEYILKRYNVHYKSRQSYYTILRESDLSFKKSQKTNPKRQARQIANIRYRLKKTFGLDRGGNTGKRADFLLSR